MKFASLSLSLCVCHEVDARLCLNFGLRRVSRMRVRAEKGLEDEG